MLKRFNATLLAAVVLGLTSQAVYSETNPGTDATVLARGKYIVQVGGCNDCHTAGYAQSGGQTPEQEWLKGDVVGWRGPWGTTYPTNLRLVIGSMSQEQWLKHARSMQPRPPMPWFNVRAMSDDDLVAMHAYVKSLGPAGQPAPSYLPPTEAPKGPYVQFPQ